MTTNQHLNNLLFLLAGSSLALACDVSSGDDGETGGGPTGTSHGTGDHDGTDTAGDETSTTEDTMPASDDLMDDGADTSTGPGDASDSTGIDADSSGSEDTGGDSELCMSYAMHISSCRTLDYTYEDGLMYCASNFELYEEGGPDCVSAGQDLYACLSTADCKGLAAGTECLDEVEAVNDICPPPR